MSESTIGLIGIAALFILLALRMPVGIVMMLIGGVGVWAINGSKAALATLGSEPFVIASNFELLIIPMFVLMGNLASISGMSRDLYGAAYAWLVIGGADLPAPRLPPVPVSLRCRDHPSPRQSPWAASPCRKCGVTTITSALPPAASPLAARWAS